MTPDSARKAPGPPPLRLRIEALVGRVWYGDSRAYLALLPLSWLFAAVTAIRRYLYRRNLFKSYRMPVPVIVVGNITAGGSGKTPVTLWLASWLREAGRNPAIISRGYGGSGTGHTERVTGNSDPTLVGDEPVLLARRGVCPVFVDPDRILAAQAAVAQGADIIISDDGLQHYRLQRDVEIAVIDGVRGLGNGLLLPAGPMREREQRLASVDRILIQVEANDSQVRYGNRGSDRRTSRFRLSGDTLVRVRDGATQPLSELAGQRVHAVAGIASPDRFFRFLTARGIDVLSHPLPDHARIAAHDLLFDDALPVVTTEKDAVKCSRFAHDRLWYLPVDLQWVGEAKGRWLNALNTRLADLFRAQRV